MRILLVNLPYFGGYKKMALDLPPLGIAYLAAVVRQCGHEVRIADLTVAPGQFPKRLEDFDLVGLSADTPRHNAAMELAGSIKKRGLPVLMGGPHVSFTTEETLRSGVVDFIVRGEGERSICALLNCLQRGEDLDAVPGLSYIQKGEIRHTKSEPLQIHVDDLPHPARDLLPMHRYGARLQGMRATSVIGSRGCPFNCSFCSSSELFGLRWRARNPQAIADEIREVSDRYGIKAFYFMDDNFTLHPDRTVEICSRMRERDLDIKWWCFSRVNTIVEREDMVQSMAEAGLQMAFLGVESPNEETLEHYHKQINADTSHRAIRILRKYGIQSMASFIIGDPEETRDMIKNTVKFAKMLNPDIAQFSILTPYPGTQLYQKVQDRLLSRPWELYDGLHATVRTDWLDAGELERLLKRAYFSFYFRLNRLAARPLDGLWYISQIPKLFKELEQHRYSLRLGAE